MILELRELGNQRTISPSSLISIIAGKNKLSFEQQDCHEFLLALLGTFYHEARSSMSLVTEVRPRVGFDGLLGTKMTCQSCKHNRGIALHSFNVLSIPIQGKSLLDCLLFFLNAELLEEVECLTCSPTRDGRKRRGFCIKQTTIARLPKNLCIHINRLAYDTSGRPYKDHRHIAFELEEDISQLCGLSNSHFSQTNTAGSGPYYSLVAVIEHLGSFNSGHYVCYRKLGGTWYKTSDSIVEIVDTHQVMRSNAFLLFYNQVHKKHVQGQDVQ